MNTSPPRMLPSDGIIPSFTLGKAEPSFLVCVDGNGFKLNERKSQKAAGNKHRHPSKPTDDNIDSRRRTSSGLRRGLRGLSKNGSRRRIGIDNSDASQKATNLSVSERLSMSMSSIDNVENNAINIQVSMRKLPDHRLPSFVGSMTDVLSRYTQSTRNIVKGEKASLIQAVFRGFLGRAKAKEQKLLNRLQDIEKAKKAALQHIEEYKRKEMSKHQARHIVKARDRKERWQNKSHVIAKLIPKVRNARETNEKLKKELVLLKKENKQLAIANSAILRSAAKEELRINRIERIGLQLHGVATDYREALLEGKKRMKDLDTTPIKVINADDELEEELSKGSGRASEIFRVLYKAKVEDQLL